MELGEVQLFRLQVPGGTTRGRGRVRNVTSPVTDGDETPRHTPGRESQKEVGRKKECPLATGRGQVTQNGA